MSCWDQHHSTWCRGERNPLAPPLPTLPQNYLPPLPTVPKGPALYYQPCNKPACPHLFPALSLIPLLQRSRVATKEQRKGLCCLSAASTHGQHVPSICAEMTKSNNCFSISLIALFPIWLHFIYTLTSLQILLSRLSYEKFI